MKHSYADLKFGHWYIVEVSFRPTNPPHRAILSDFRLREGRESPDATLTGNYEPSSLEFFKLEKLHYFKVIKEIPEMREMGMKWADFEKYNKEMNADTNFNESMYAPKDATMGEISEFNEPDV